MKARNDGVLFAVIVLGAALTFWLTVAAIAVHFIRKWW